MPRSVASISIIMSFGQVPAAYFDCCELSIHLPMKGSVEASAAVTRAVTQIKSQIDFFIRHTTGPPTKLHRPLHNDRKKSRIACLSASERLLNRSTTAFASEGPYV